MAGGIVIEPPLVITPRGIMVTIGVEERMDAGNVEAAGRALTTIGARPGAGAETHGTTD